MKRGEKIITQGEVGDSLFAVVSGNVDVLVKDNNGKDIVISRITTGEIFGESAIFSGKQTHRQRGLFRQHHCHENHPQESDFFILKTYPHAGNKLLMLMILNLLNKLRHANEDLILEKQSDLDFNYVDNLIQEFISETDLPSD